MWVTIWWAGYVVFTVGYAEMSAPLCEDIKSGVAYDVSDRIDAYEITCEDTRLEIGWRL